MLVRSQDLQQVVDGNSLYVDGLISTDTYEFGDYLEKMLGFHQPSRSFEIKNGHSIGEDNIGYELLVKGQDKISIECVDFPLPSFEQAANFRKDFGFVPMSWFRLHCSGDTAIRELVGIKKTLAGQRHNLALVNSSSTRVYVTLSEFYC